MRFLRHLPPTVGVLLLLGMLVLLVVLGIWIWAALLIRGHLEGWPQWLLPVGLALVELGGACISTVIAYGARSLRFLRTPGLRSGDAALWLDTWRGMPWLDTWRGQFTHALAVGAFPIATVVAVLLIPPSSPLFLLGYVFLGLSSFVGLAAAVSGAILHSHLAEATRA